MIEQQQYRYIPTELQLNGPIISFTTTPLDTTHRVGESAYFTGIATVQFPTQVPTNPAVGFATGTIQYQWYEVTEGQLSDGTKYVGTATTQLFVNDLASPDDNGKQYYLGADYVAIGTSPNANNDLFTSSRATLTIYPEITINTQPVSGTIASGVTTTFTVDASISDPSFGSLNYQWQLDQTNLTDDAETSGSNSSTLSISRSTVGVSSVRVLVSAASTDTVTSTEVSFTRIEPRSLVKIEGYGTSSTATLLETDLDNEDFVISADNLNFDDICFYAAEKDIELELDIYGAKGDDKGNFVGGEGGYSRINFTMEKNEEYIVRGIKSDTGLFLYRKGSLIAVVGSGGDAGNTGNGGKGGGVNLAGGAGTGSGGGSGGARVGIGNLLENGTLGSASGLPASELYPEDGKSIGTSGGITIKCAKGKYWRDQGKSSCEDLGKIKFRLSDGTEVTNSAEIDRGFKAGYSINRTAGAYDSGAGFGGDGATGGDGGGTGQGGGGGGSGYSDGSSNITRTQLGGNSGTARIGLRIYKPDEGFYIDDQGRILIMSCTDIRDPNTLEITTGKIFVGDNKVLDDARWQNFLDLARDGQQNWRLTATLNNSNVKIINATSNNIYKMMNANQLTLRTSLARGWVDMSYVSGYSGRKGLAWDESSGASITGIDYSLLWWVNGSGWGYYGHSSNSFFTPTIYHQKSANYWILPPGVPDF
jgi:hypothetical protein